MTGQIVKLGDVVELVSGAAFKSAQFTDDPSDIALVKGENVGQGEVLWEISKYWPIAQATEYSRFQLAPNDVVLAMDRPWVPAGLKFAWIRKDAPTSLLVQRVARLRALEGFDQTFLRYIIASKSFSDYIQNIMGGTNVPHISGDQIRRYEFQLPSLSDQQRLGSVLSNYDDLIANNKRRIDLLEQSARLLFKEWFVHLRYPGHEHDKVVDGVPAGWERIALGEVITLQRGFDLPTNVRKEGDVPIYASTGIAGYHDVAKVGAPGVVTGRSGSLGAVIYIDREFWPLNTALWVKEFKRVDALYAKHLLEGLNLAQLNGGAAVPTLNRNDAHRVKVLCPPRSLHDTFEDIASDCYRQIGILTRTNERLAKARDLLLPRLMDGRLTV